jgi:hypothetical protein
MYEQLGLDGMIERNSEMSQILQHLANSQGHIGGAAWRISTFKHGKTWQRMDTSRMHGSAAARADIEHEADLGLMDSNQWLTEKAGFVVQTCAPLPSHQIIESYKPWSKPHEQEDHSIADTT